MENDAPETQPTERRLKLLTTAVETFPAIAEQYSQPVAYEPSEFLPDCIRLVKTCMQSFQAEACSLYLIRGDEVVLEAAKGYEHMHGMQIPIPQLRGTLRYRVKPPDTPVSDMDGISGYVASTGKEFTADSRQDVVQHPSHKGKPDSLGIWDEVERPFRNMFALPLKVAGRTIGVLKVENKKPRDGESQTFTEHDKEMMRMLGQYFSISIEEHAGQGTRPLGKKLPPHDHSHMDVVIQRLPDHIELALARALPDIPTGPFRDIVVCGLGGSALPSEVLMDAFAEELLAPMRVWRTYGLPGGVNAQTLLIVSSFSGNTEETLSGIESLPRGSNNVVVVAAGGRLADIARERRYPLILIPTHNEPEGFQPRSAFGFFVTYFARVLHAAGLMKDPRPTLHAVSAFLRKLDLRDEAIDVATWLEEDRIPIIYTDDGHMMSVGRIAKIKFNENAKRAAFFNSFPELNHNEMIGFTIPIGRFGVLYFDDPGSHPRIRKRFEVMRTVFARERVQHVAFRSWTMPGTSRAERVFASLMFADWCSYATALMSGLDPTPVNLVENFKRVLGPLGAASEAAKKGTA